MLSERPDQGAESSERRRRVGPPPREVKVTANGIPEDLPSPPDGGSQSDVASPDGSPEPLDVPDEPVDARARDVRGRHTRTRGRGAGSAVNGEPRKVVAAVVCESARPV